MITLQGMADHSFSNVYNYQCLTLVTYSVIVIFPLIPFPSYLLSPSYIGFSKEKQKYTAKLIFLCDNNFSKKDPLYRNGMTVIPKIFGVQNLHQKQSNPDQLINHTFPFPLPQTSIYITKHSGMGRGKLLVRFREIYVTDGSDYV